MPVEENPYEAMPFDPVSRNAGGRRRLTIGEGIAAFVVTLIVSVVTLFVTCLGVIDIGAGGSFHRAAEPLTEPFATLLLLFLWVGVPVLLAAIAGRLTLRSFVRAVTAAPPDGSIPQANSSDEMSVDPGGQREDHEAST